MTRTDYAAIGENIFTDTLPNGLRLSVITKPGYSRCHAYFATNYGGADRRFKLGGEFIETPSGVAHFLEHKMFDLPDGDSALNVLASNGAQPNAYTSDAITAYYFESTENFYENLRMLLRFVSTPYFTEASVAKEQGIIAQEIRMYDDSPDYVAYFELIRSLYAHSTIRDSVVGTVESIAEITPDTLYSCHRVFYNPGNMCLCVVGDVDPEQVKSAALEILPPHAGEVPGRDHGEKEGLMPVRERFEKAMDVSAPQLLTGLKLSCPSDGTELLRKKIICGLALSCLFGESSPFYLRNYENGLLNTDFSTELYTAAGTMTVLIGGETTEPDTVCSLIAEEFKNGGDNIDEDYFRRIKRASYGARIRALSSFGGLCASMADGAFEGYGCLDSFAITDGVTLSDVRAFIRENLLPERMAVSVITPIAAKEEK